MLLFFSSKGSILPKLYFFAPFLGGVNACRDGLWKLFKVIFSPEGKKKLARIVAKYCNRTSTGYITQKQKIPYFHLPMACGKKSVVVSSRKKSQIVVFCLYNQRDLTTMIIDFEVQLKM